MIDLSRNNPLAKIALRHLQSTAIALISDTGQLIDASVGFLKLIPMDGALDGQENVTKYFLQPTFLEIKDQVTASSARYISGKFALGSRTGETFSLNGFMYRNGEHLLFVGEHDADNLSKTQKKLLTLNQSLIDSTRDISYLLRESKQLADVSHRESLTDALTGLGNRRQLYETLDVALKRSIAEKTPLGLIMADLDHFKRVNDTYGHAVGDIVLKTFAKLIQENIRSVDVATRYGGEEFLVLMPGTNKKSVINIAERIRLALENYIFPNYPIRITASFGVSCCKDGDTADTLIQRADNALYRAKANGRNRVEILSQV